MVMHCTVLVLRLDRAKRPFVALAVPRTAVYSPLDKKDGLDILMG